MKKLLKLVSSSLPRPSLSRTKGSTNNDYELLDARFGVADKKDKKAKNNLLLLMYSKENEAFFV